RVHRPECRRYGAARMWNCGRGAPPAVPTARKHVMGYSGPEPAEDACGEKCVDECVEHVLERCAPLASGPDRLLHLSQSIRSECSRAGEAEGVQVIRTRAECASRDVCGEDAHDHGQDEPLHQVLAPGGLTGRVDGHEHDGTFAVL